MPNIVTLDRATLTEALRRINPGAPQGVTNEVGHQLLHALEDIFDNQPHGTSFRKGHLEAPGHAQIRRDCKVDHSASDTYRVYFDDGSSADYPKPDEQGTPAVDNDGLIKRLEEAGYHEVASSLLSDLNRKDQHRESLREAAEEVESRQGLPQGHTTAGPNPGVSQTPCGSSKDWTNPLVHVVDTVRETLDTLSKQTSLVVITELIEGRKHDRQFRVELVARIEGLLEIVKRFPEAGWPAEVTELRERFHELDFG